MSTGGGGFRQGTSLWGQFFQFGVKIFPTKIFYTIWGSSCALCILSVHAFCETTKMLPWDIIF